MAELIVSRGLYDQGDDDLLYDMHKDRNAEAIWKRIQQELLAIQQDKERLVEGSD